MRGVGIMCKFVVTPLSVALAALLCLALLTAGCRQAKPLPQDEIMTIRLGLPRQPSSGLVWIAMEKGFFKKQKLNVQIEEYPSGKRALREGLFAGKVDLAVTSEVPVATAITDGEDCVILAGIFQDNKVNSIIANRRSGIRTPEDLQGKRIGIQENSVLEYYLHLFAMDRGMSSDQFEVEMMKIEELPRALAEQRIDAAALRPPFSTAALELLGDEAVVFSDANVYTQLELVVGNRKFVGMNPKAVRRFLAALIEAEGYVYRNQEEARDYIANTYQVDSGYADSILGGGNMHVALGQAGILYLENVSRWYLQNKKESTSKCPNYLDYIEAGYLNSVNPGRVTIVSGVD